MRKLIAMIWMALFAQGAVAQIESGTIRFGPTFEFSTDTEDDSEDKYTDIKIGVNASYFVIQNLGVGLDILGQFAKQEEGGVEATSTSFGIGPHVMYMIGLSEQFYIPVYARYLFSSETLDLPFIGETKGTGTLLGFGTGIEYLVANKLGLRLNIGYEIVTRELEDLPESNSETFGLKSSLGVGLYF